MTATPPAPPPKGRTSLARETPTLKVGDRAPDFDLPAHDGTRASLGALRGKRVVLAFMVHAFTNTWSHEAPLLSGLADRFAQANAQVVGITCDPVASLTAWAKSFDGLTYPLASDFWPHGAVCRAYGTFNEERGRSDRAIFIVDPEGIVRYIDMHALREVPDEAEIFDALAQMPGASSAAR